MKLIKKLLFLSTFVVALLACVVSFKPAVSEVSAAPAAEDAPQGYTFDTVVDEMSLFDIKMDNNMYTKVISSKYNYDCTFDYSAANTNKSVVFKIKYNVAEDIEPEATRLSIKFAVQPDDKSYDDVKWGNKNALSLLTNKTVLHCYDGSNSSTLESADDKLKVGLSEIEFGRIALLSDGTASGSYYVYYKINGVTIASTTSVFDVNELTNRMFFNMGGGSVGDTIYDATSFETPDEVSIADLKKDGNKVGDIINLPSSGSGPTYTYDATAEHKSVKYTFKYEVTKKANCEFFMFDDNKTGYLGALRFRSDGVFFNYTKNDVKEIKTVKAEIGNTYTIEYSKIYISSGLFKGQSYMSVKVDGTLLCEYVVAGMPETNQLHLWVGDGNAMLDVDYVRPTFEEAFTVSVGDLRESGALVGNSVILDKDHLFTYDTDSEHKSVVFKFKYEVRNARNHDDKRGGNNGGHIFFNNAWSDNMPHFWLRADKAFLINVDAGGNSSSSAGKINEAKIYNMEIGKLYITAGSGAGSYYIYLKVNGNIVLETYTTKLTANNNIFMYFSSGDVIYDEDCVDPTYETPDQIGVNDLKVQDVSVINSVYLDKVHTFDYTATAEHKSVVFKFQIEGNKGTQIEFRSSQACEYYAWVRYDGAFLGYKKGENKKVIEVRTDKAKLLNGQMNQIEYGKIFIKTGEYANQYYFYLKVNGIVVAEYTGGAGLEEEAKVTITGSGKNHLYAIGVTPCTTHATLVEHNEVVAHTCTTDGKIAYWQCPTCGMMFSDAAGTTEIGTFVDFAGHNLTHHEAAAGSDCQHKGTIEYWSCSGCEKNFSDKDAKTEATSIEAELGNHISEHHVAVAGSDCQHKGTIEYWECTVCHKLYSDSALATEITSVEGSLGAHNIEHHAAQAGSDCEHKGNIEYWECSVCHEKYSDAQGQTVIQNVEAEYGAHNCTHYSACAATCFQDGNVEFYQCKVCGKKFSDSSATTEKATVVIPHHEVEHHNAEAATCTAGGKIEYYYCETCDKYYDKDFAEIAEEDIFTAKAEHFYDKGVCTECQAKDPNYKAKAGCGSVVSVSGIAFFASLALAFVAKKRKETR